MRWSPLHRRRASTNVRGEWVCLYRAVDRTGNIVDFRLSPRRDVAAAKAFFRKAIKGQGSSPRTVTLDSYAASHRAVRKMKADGELPADTKLRSSEYPNNRIEQDHRGVKLRIGPRPGFKRFRTAAITIAGIELLRRIRKEQFHLGQLRPRDRSAPAVWEAVLAAPESREHQRPTAEPLALHPIGTRARAGSEGHARAERSHPQ